MSRRVAPGVTALLSFALIAIDVSGMARAKESELERSIDMQVRLAWAHASPGPIDGRRGKNTRSALEAFQRMRGLEITGKPDEATLAALPSDTAKATLIDYEITNDDLKGPFADDVPKTLVEMADLEHLSYSTPVEALAEKFRMDEALLKRLNGGKDFGRAGTLIRVANARHGKLGTTVVRIVIDKSDQTVLAFGEGEKLVAVYPATIGSEETPSPSGSFKVKAIARNPTYVYDPKKLDFKGVDAKEKLTIAPGPNNPVGLVWIGLGKEGFGIHGSPEPSRIRRQESHGCVRLTNWDALALADAVKAGVDVEFVDSATER